MTKYFLITLTFLFLITGCTQSQTKEKIEFEFPQSKMGEFAKIWFEFINSGTKNEILKYDKDKEWEDHLSMLRGLSQGVKGISPFLISYETDDFISIYSKENEGAWVKVNLGLNSNDEITAIGIKKSFKPIDYDLRNKLTKEQIHDLVGGISHELRTNYVIEKLRPTYSTKLLRLLDSGKYNSITQGDLLADILTQDLIELSNDKHLQIIPPSRINEVVKRFGTEDQNIEKQSNHSSPSDELTLEDENINSKLLEKNIGLITISRFVDNEKSAIATKNAFLSLSDSKAIIIDLRYSGGGDARAVADLMSYFFTKDELYTSFPELVENKEARNDADQNELRSTFLEKPLFVLTSSKTISAGEAFVYYLQEKKRATIIGEKTAGAGYRVDVFELPYDFYFVNSIFTTFDTEKGEGWQGTGVRPDISTSSSKALDEALSNIK